MAVRKYCLRGKYIIPPTNLAATNNNSSRNTRRRSQSSQIVIAGFHLAGLWSGRQVRFVPSEEA
jgi:hypothetical protein